MWILISVLILGFVYAQWIEPRWFRLRHVTIRVPKKLPRPVTILHISDTHFVKKDPSKEKFFRDRLFSLMPDFVFVTGDVIDDNSGIGLAGSLLSGLRARIGKFAVIGNHDYWNYQAWDNFKYHFQAKKTSDKPNDIQRLKHALEEAGCSVLVDEKREVLVDGLSVMIGGADDPMTGKVRMESILDGFCETSLNILLIHNLDFFAGKPDVPFDLIFSGHTHGAQLRLPWAGGYVYDFHLPQRYADGIHPLGDSIACVSRGLGATHSLALRFFCRPEALLIRIESV